MDRGVAHQGERVGLAEHAQRADDLLQRLVELEQRLAPCGVAEEVVQHLLDVGEAGEHLLRKLLERGALLRLAGVRGFRDARAGGQGLAALQGEQPGGDALGARAEAGASGGRRSSAPSMLSKAVATSIPAVSANCSGSRRNQHARSRAGRCAGEYGRGGRAPGRGGHRREGVLEAGQGDRGARAEGLPVLARRAEAGGERVEQRADRHLADLRSCVGDLCV